MNAEEKDAVRRLVAHYLTTLDDWGGDDVGWNDVAEMLEDELHGENPGCSDHNHEVATRYERMIRKRRR